MCAPSCSPDDSDGYCCEVDNDNPGCEIDTIEMCVCEADMFCCDEFWDVNCVAAIAENDCSMGMCPAG